MSVPVGDLHPGVPGLLCGCEAGMSPALADYLLTLISEFGDAREDTSGRSDDLQRTLFLAIEAIVKASVA